MVWSKSHLPSDAWGTSYDKLMHSTDWLPTLASLVGAELTGRCVGRDDVMSRAKTYLLCDSLGEHGCIYMSPVNINEWYRNLSNSVMEQKVVPFGESSVSPPSS